MAEVVPKLDTTEREDQVQILGKRGRSREIRPEDSNDLVEKKLSVVSSQMAIAPFSKEPQSSSTLLFVKTDDQVLAKATRQRYTQEDHILLIKYVKELLPVRARFEAILAAWDDVANKLNRNPDFFKDKIKGPIVRYRFKNLVGKSCTG
ncbi:uncharacterized protein PHALS_04286 [Plasmopara halstedii]|uniref:Uncharacterized protein n=1 Tax=Plasmopara halstedii TaxID=4781 RepID=A0A0N7L7L5_PLAHL|nr:uncharacterized protein PHALS_04286 [Plasmopara halstedii]CEG47411.1 hypothetical protein PHALS_04286 [Plasmopara halstedii]|eukprot:XP_024583780.1 hypothetical protein PHALS_04286 [Plasmopara halstedii]